MARIPEEAKVVYNYVGRSGLKVANIGFGAATFGDSEIYFPVKTNEELAHRLLDRYVAWGGNFLDTADVYASGQSEQIVGTWLKKQKREDFVVATKVGFYGGLSRRNITQSIDKSLERLQTHYVDLYQMHIWNDATPIEETLRTFDDLVRCGKVRYVGASNVLGWQLQKIMSTSEKLGLNPFASLQQQYSLVCRETEFESLQVCKKEGLGVLPWSPLKGGLLTGKYDRKSKPTSGRLAWTAKDEAKRENEAAPAWTQTKANAQIWDIIDCLRDIAKSRDKTVAQVALRWLVQKDVVSSVIVGATTLSQLDDNMGAANGWSLTTEEMSRLDAVSQPTIPYPYRMVWKFNESGQY